MSDVADASFPPHDAAAPLGWRDRRRLRQELELVRRSPLFDAEWYCRRYPAEAAAADPALHFLLHGAAEEHDPGPAFSTAAYYAANPDVAEAGVNALSHYLVHGRAEGRALRPEAVLAADELPAVAPRRGRASPAPLLRTLRRTLQRPRSTFRTVHAEGGGGEAVLRRVRGSAPTDWCLLRVTAYPPEVQVSLRAFRDGTMQELSLGTASDARRLQLVRLPGTPTRLGLRCDPHPGEAAERDAMPAQVVIREIGRIEALLHLLAGLSARPVALLAAAARGRLGALLRAAAARHTPQELTGYQNWIRLYDTPSAAQLGAMRARARSMVDPPRFSVLVPTYNTAARPLREMLASVRAQVYPHWELCIADDASSRPHVRAILQQAMADEPRIRVRFRTRNGNISAASNSALSLAGGDFALLLDHDDVLAPHAMLAMADAIAANPRADLLYSDEDKLDEHGRRYDPYFKPDFSPELLQAQNFVSHLGAYRMTMLRAAGGFREGFEGSQDYDLALRVAARTRAPVVHVPQVLYHWRLYPGAGTFSSTQVARATAAARRAIADQAAERGETLRVVDGVAHYHRVVRPPLATWPLVSVIVPTRDHIDVLRDCIDGLLDGTDYPALEILVVDNGSVEPATAAYLREIERRGVRVLAYPGAFNYSAINNVAAREARGEMLLLLNSDVSMLDRAWLQEMVQQTRGPRVGAVGARLLYPDFTVQHAGVVLGLGGAAGHIHLGAGRDDPGYFGHLAMAHEVSAVTAACVLVPRDCFWQVGGLDEENLPVAFNDVDFCLRLREAGWRVVWTPYAELVHHESKSRGSDFTPERFDKFHAEVAYMRRRWGDLLPCDPFHNPNLSLEHARPTPAFPPRGRQTWAVPAASPPAAGTRAVRPAEAAVVT